MESQLPGRRPNRTPRQRVSASHNGRPPAPSSCDTAELPSGTHENCARTAAQFGYVDPGFRARIGLQFQRRPPECGDATRMRCRMSSRT